MARKKHHFLKKLLLTSAVGAGVFEGINYRVLMEKFTRKDPDPAEETDPRTPAHYRRFHAQKREALPALDRLGGSVVEIRSHDGLGLRGRLYRVKENNDKVALLVHGYHASGMNDMARFVHMYTRLGYDFLIISQRAHEMSDGKYISFGVNEHRDGIGWCEKIRELYGNNVRIVIHGLSMGAATVLMMSGSAMLPPQVKACVADSPYDDMYLEADHVIQAKITSEKVRKVLLENMSLLTNAVIGFRLQEAAPIQSVKHARIPILFIHGTGDDFVPCEMGQRLYEACSGEKEQFLVKGAAHVCSYTEAPEEYEKHVSTFFKKYVR